MSQSLLSHFHAFRGYIALPSLKKFCHKRLSFPLSQTQTLEEQRNRRKTSILSPFKQSQPPKMRPAPLPAIASLPQRLVHFTSSPPPLPPPAATCIPHGGCKWRPSPSSSPSSDSSGEFQAYAAVAVIILLSALICALALHGASRCFLCRRPPDQQDLRLPKHASEAPAGQIWPGPTVPFSQGMDMAGTGECAICLTEFVEGEEIRLMAECRHGFHGPCIQTWLCSHSSCPNCRRECLAVSVSVGNGSEEASVPVPQQHV